MPKVGEYSNMYEAVTAGEDDTDDTPPPPAAAVAATDANYKVDLGTGATALDTAAVKALDLAGLTALIVPTTAGKVGGDVTIRGGKDYDTDLGTTKAEFETGADLAAWLTAADYSTAAALVTAVGASAQDDEIVIIFKIAGGADYLATAAGEYLAVYLKIP
jgi:hypothetical protein